MVQVLSLLDLTSLNDTDTAETIDTLCQNAKSHHVAAVCVYPRFVKQAATALQNTHIKIATVVNFPKGTDSLENVLLDIKQAIQDGADEIDVVFPYQQFLAGNVDSATHFIRECKLACGKNILKVILETGALKEKNLIAEASRCALAAGADFLKTSTGKIEVGATLEAAEIMLQEIKQSKKQVGFKASGGIRTAEQAKQYVELANQILGEGWVTPQTFRIGTSRLLN